MRLFYRFLIGILTVAILIGALFVFSKKENAEEFVLQEKRVVPVSVTQEQKVISTALHGVPFTPQAPLGNWADKRQQDACEETIALMAVSWARGETFTRAEALQKIIEISDWELVKYGEFRDTSAEDTVARIFQDYFQFEGAHTEYDVMAEDLIRELQRGNIVAIPVAGRALKNPFFTQPGPLHHMILVIGYDTEAREFIVHDPGTKHGENFRYNRLVLENAMRDYPTGAYGIAENPRKVMIVIEKS